MKKAKAPTRTRSTSSKPEKAAGPIVGVNDVYYNVEDMDRAVKFYRDVLGLTVKETSEWWTSLDVNGVRVGLHGMGGEKIQHPARDAHGAHGGATLTLRVADIDAAVATLKERGVKFLGGISRDPWGSLATFEDSEGNVLKLMQPPTRSY